MIILVLALLGLCLGSFTNALVWRLHEQRAGSAKERKKVPKELTISQGRSMCPDCRHQLGFWDLIPVFSWLWLRGKCRYCKKAISPQYPVIEVITASLFVGSYVVWPFDWDTVGLVRFIIWLPLLVIFVALTVYDYHWQLLPNRLVYPAGVLALAQVILLTIISKDPAVLLTALIGVLCLGGLFYALFQISGGRWIGGGDVRLGVVIGLLVGGPTRAILVLFIASTLGTIFSLPSLSKKQSALKRRVAFGPFLIIATVMVYLFGTAVISAYKERFLLL